MWCWRADSLSHNNINCTLQDRYNHFNSHISVTFVFAHINHMSRHGRSSIEYITDKGKHRSHPLNHCVKFCCTVASTLSCRLDTIFMGRHWDSQRLSLSPPPPPLDDKLQLQLISRLTSIHMWNSPPRRSLYHVLKDASEFGSVTGCSQHVSPNTHQIRSLCYFCNGLHLTNDKSFHQ